jgi:hypothetical protein
VVLEGFRRTMSPTFMHTLILYSVSAATAMAPSWLAIRNVPDQGLPSWGRI